MPPAFAPENARLDARNLAELLADFARIATDIPFHNDAGEVDGNWRRVLLADQSFVLALLVTAEIDSHAEPIAVLLDAARRGGAPHENETRLTELVEALLRFADDLDAWLAPADLGGATRGRSVRGLAEEVIERVLGPQLQRLVDHVAAIEEAELTERFRHARWDLLRRPWRRAALEGEIRGVADAVERAWADRMLGELADAVEAFVEEMGELGRRAGDAFGASLVSGDHSPHPALAIAFARIFGHALDLLNRIPEQWIDFYQHRLLHAAPAGARPDRMLLALVPRPGTRPKLSRGTLIPAGGAIAFATEAALDVTGARLQAARLWRPDATVTQLAPGPDGALGDPALGIAAPLPGEAFEAHAIFATPLLDLPGGTRRLLLEIALDQPLDAAVSAALTVSVTTAKGWLPIAAAVETEADLLRISCTLPPDFPALAPFNDFPGSPALRVTHAGRATAAPIRDARLDIAVKDLPGIAVRTPAGPASAVAAAPFGAPPGPGGWLRVDHPILAGPALDRLVLRLEWAGLPPGDGGFASYYQGYAVDAQGQLFDWPPFDNAAFVVTLAAPLPGWDPTHRLPLFAPASLGSAPPVAAAPPPDVFAADFEPAPPLMPERGPLAPGSWLAASATTDGSPRADHVCVTLAGPTYGFGHALHAANVQYATEAIARGDAPRPAPPGFLRRLLRAILRFPGKLLRNLEGVESVEPEPSEPVIVLLPNPPLQPLLAGIALDCAWRVAADALNLHHAATLTEPARIALRNAPLFPAAPEVPALELRFDGAGPGDVLALLVRIAATGIAPRNPAWWYRGRDRWQPLAAEALLADQTQGLTATGIVRIAIPDDAASPLALRLRFAGPDIPAIVAVLPDAVSATRLVDGSETAMLPVPAGTVTRLAGLARVVQPLDSAGGQPPEPQAMLRARTAERVRHRARGLTAWDIERLVLAEFPDIARVRVLPAGDPACDSSTATIRMIVIPVAGTGDPLRPCAPAQLRADIADRLATLASPFARIDVVDPVYVPVDVSARLILDRSDVAPIEAALAGFLSPWAAPGLDLDDAADADDARSAIARFLRAQPAVRAIDQLDVALPGAAGWRVPIAGTIAVSGVAALATASW